MVNYYKFWLEDEGLLITILQALKPLDKDAKILVVDRVIDYIVNKEIADSLAYDYYDPHDYTPDDYDFVYHGWADYSDSYYTD